jgi:hypothetical protein
MDMRPCDFLLQRSQEVPSADLLVALRRWRQIPDIPIPKFVIVEMRAAGIMAAGADELPIQACRTWPGQ